MNRECKAPNDKLDFALCPVCGKAFEFFGLGSHVASHKRKAAKLQRRIDELRILEAHETRWFSDSEHNELQRLKQELKQNT